MDAMSQADVVGTRRDEPIIHPMVTEVALLCNPFVPVKGNGPMGAGINTLGTPGAPAFMQHNNAVPSLGYGLFGAYRHAGGIVTVPADVDLKGKIELFPGLLIDFLRHGDQPRAEGGSDLLFAGDLAGLTSPAGVVIDV